VSIEATRVERNRKVGLCRELQRKDKISTIKILKSNYLVLRVQFVIRQKWQLYNSSWFYPMKTGSGLQVSQVICEISECSFFDIAYLKCLDTAT
jgi:hypothetical protein